MPSAWRCGRAVAVTRLPRFRTCLRVVVYLVLTGNRAQPRTLDVRALLAWS